MFGVAGSFDKRSHTKHVSTSTEERPSNVIVIAMLHSHQIFARIFAWIFAMDSFFVY